MRRTNIQRFACALCALGLLLQSIVATAACANCCCAGKGHVCRCSLPPAKPVKLHACCQAKKAAACCNAAQPSCCRKAAGEPASGSGPCRCHVERDDNPVYVEKAYQTVWDDSMPVADVLLGEVLLSSDPTAATLDASQCSNRPPPDFQATYCVWRE